MVGPGEQDETLTDPSDCFDFVPDVDGSAADNGGAQATPVNERRQHVGLGQRGQMGAWLAEAVAPEHDITHAEFLPDEVIERHTTCDDIAAALSRRQFDVVFMSERGQRFAFGKRKWEGGASRCLTNCLIKRLISSNPTSKPVWVTVFPCVSKSATDSDILSRFRYSSGEIP